MIYIYIILYINIYIYIHIGDYHEATSMVGNQLGTSRQKIDFQAVSEARFWVTASTCQPA